MRGPGRNLSRRTVTVGRLCKGRQRSPRWGSRLMRLTTLFCLAVFGSGCWTDPAGPSLKAADSALHGEEHLQGAAEADFVARALAMAMKEPGIRFVVRDAMRASSVTEHKLVLQEFAMSEPGRTVVGAAARAVGISGDSLQNLISKIPLADFYVPSAAHRRNWRGEGNAFVAAAFAGDLTNLVAMRPDGVRQRLSPADRAAASVVFLVQPAERKSRRIRPQRSVPGLTIQDADDGQISGTLVEYRPDGTTRVTELADYFALRPMFSEACDPNTALQECSSEDVGANIVSPDTTYLEHVIIISVCDNWNCDEGNEFEWRTYFSSDDGATYGSRFDLRVEGVPSNFEGTWNFPALLKEIRYPQDRVKSDVVETDWAHPDDKFEPSPIWDYYNTDGRLKAEGDWRCDYPTPYGGTYTCDVFFWKEVNQSLRW